MEGGFDGAGGEGGVGSHQAEGDGGEAGGVGGLGVVVVEQVEAAALVEAYAAGRHGVGMCRGLYFEDYGELRLAAQQLYGRGAYASSAARGVYGEVLYIYKGVEGPDGDESGEGGCVVVDAEQPRH